MRDVDLFRNTSRSYSLLFVVHPLYLPVRANRTQQKALGVRQDAMIIVQQDAMIIVQQVTCGGVREDDGAAHLPVRVSG